MAFKNGLSERLDELRFPSPRSPPADAPFAAYAPLSPQANLMSAFQRPSTDVRANLQRRFTTDAASKLSSWTFVNPQPPVQSSESIDLMSSATHIHKSQLFEKKRQHIEYMREQRKRFEADMKLLDLQHEKEKQEMDQLARDLAQAGLSGPVSEPTTPPEHRDVSFPTAFPRATRFSTSSVTSSPGIFNIFSPTSVTSPPSTSHTRNGTASTPNHRFSVQSVPGSRRNSEEDEYFPESASAFRPNPSIHRYSMPTTSLASQLRPSTATYNSSTLEPFNAAKLLFGDEGKGPKDEDRLPTPDIKSYLKLTDPDDKFPTLSHNSGLLSANSDALDLANSRTPEPWNTHNRYRSMPQGDLSMFRSDQLDGPSPTDANHHARHAARHSVELNLFLGKQETSTPAQPSTRPVTLQSSYSTNDLPTVKTNGGSAITPPKSHAEHFHQHNASLGRIPPGAATGRPAKESPEREESVLATNGGAPPSALQATAAPFGPQLSAINGSALAGPTAVPNPLQSYQSQYLPFPVQPYLNNGIPVNGSAVQNFNAQAPYPAFGQNGAFQFPRGSGRPANATAHRNGESDAQQVSRFANLPLEHYRGDLYGLCKDQHGCRYLQRKLEERNPEHVQMIFNETYMHVVELMTDPFGNYLCQKLLEFSNDDQRTRLIHNAAPQLVPIALNQHGTRALQKMIEFVSTPQQIQMVIDALRGHVVDLVQDLNGNHVIQKCLNRLSAEDAQFIYDAVGSQCVVVGTHRHGCCVLQRCIDHASGEQRARLISQITANAFSLVQDPFGNYVVQYILDLSEPHFTEPLCQTFLGNIPPLSKQKFSSNVIEKCLRTADMPMRRRMVEELLVPRELEAMLRDSFANYVVQTAMDYVDAETRTRLMDVIRPILPSIRQTPHGRRIAGKMAGAESSGRNSGNPSGQVTPNETTTGQLPASMQVPPKPFLQNHNSFSGNGSTPQHFGTQPLSPSSTFGASPNPQADAGTFNPAHSLPQGQTFGGNSFY